VVPWSIVSDRIGRVKAMSIAVIAATAVGLLAPFAPSMPLLLTGRLLEGLMVGGAASREVRAAPAITIYTAL
jgi:MFS family permease